MAQASRVYSDIDFNFDVHPLTGNLTKVYDGEAVKQSIKNLVLTNFYERPFRPALAGDVTSYLFENATVFTQDNIKTAVKDVIRSHEPRARNVVVDTNMLHDDNELNVTVTFETANVENPITLEIVLKRIR